LAVLKFTTSPIFRLFKDVGDGRTAPKTGAFINTALLKEGKVAVKGFAAEKTGNKYDATVVLDDTGDKFVRYKLEF